MTRTTATAPVRSAALQSDIESIGRGLARSFTAVIDSLPTDARRPQSLAKMLGVNVVLTSRLLKALRTGNGLTVAYFFPGPEPLRRVLRAAERRRVPAKYLQAAESSVERFQHLIDEILGGRAGLDALLSAWLPEAREQAELIAKQSVFRGMAQIKGHASDHEHCACLIHPSPDGRYLDRLSIMASLGLRRLRPNVPLSWNINCATPGVLAHSLDRDPDQGVSGAVLVEYCSRPAPSFTVAQSGPRVRYALDETGVGPKTSVDLVFAEVRRRALHREFVEGADHLVWAALTADLPTKRLVMDLLMHEDVFPSARPELRVYDCATRRGLKPTEPVQPDHLMNTRESLASVGTGTEGLACAGFNRYTECAREVCAQLGWDIERFRVFRADIAYPVMGSEVVIQFDRPDA